MIWSVVPAVVDIQILVDARSLDVAVAVYIMVGVASLSNSTSEVLKQACDRYDDSVCVKADSPPSIAVLELFVKAVPVLSRSAYRKAREVKRPTSYTPRRMKGRITLSPDKMWHRSYWHPD